MITFEEFTDVRKRLRLTNEQAALLLGVSRRTLVNYANTGWAARVYPRLEVFSYLRDILISTKLVNASPEQAMRTISEDVITAGANVIEPDQGGIFEFLALNFDTLKKVAWEKPNYKRYGQLIVIVATTSLSNEDQNDDESVLYIKSVLDFNYQSSFVIDTGTLKQRMLSGQESIPEPLICVGPPERNYLTAILGSRRVNLPDEVRNKYAGKLLPEQDMVICKVAGKAIYIVFADNPTLQDEASQLIADMIVAHDLDLTPGSTREGEMLPPLKKGGRRG